MHDELRYDDSADPARRSGRGGRVVAVLIAIVAAVGVYLAYRGELPGWASHGEENTAILLGPPQPPMDAPAVAKAVEPELVNINVALRPVGMSAAGTGIVLTAQGEILTSQHVIKGADSITVGDLGTGTVYSAAVVGYDSSADIALLSLSGADRLPVARIGSSAPLRLGDSVLAIGNAGGTGSPTATPGTVTSLSSSIVARDNADLSRKPLTGMVEIAAPVVSGQSGGALVDRYGSVVGVVTAASGEVAKAAGRASGYAVPIDTAMDVVRTIRSGTPTDTVHIGPTATLGVLTSDATPTGARVDVAVYGQPAYAAGLTQGEVITAVDGRAVTSAQSLKASLNSRKPDDTVHVDVLGPNGSHRVVAIVLAAGPPN
ncbi:S1C family serine protease [Nocardia terpenica]|uniref:Protease n=1 Tax=Nocardia terpenica TaxID=455432 RepID=A0A164KB98_9NOCA|nr:trypsin-like peptidase domain-containing protein [Nocardia terpenica]KZM71224.1 protease [Nocardia terpenica]NQE89833.1 PDZ domain-containing protein [Nocardia terpenica]